jgi:hypothetical protein
MRYFDDKGRRLSKTRSRPLSAIRGIEARHFDALIAVFFDSSFEVLQSMEITVSNSFVLSEWKSRRRPLRSRKSISASARSAFRCSIVGM